MRISMLLPVAAIALAVSSAHAGPASVATAGLPAAAEHTNLTETIAYRRCWWRGGKRVCRYARYRYRYYPYYAYSGQYNGYGSSIGPITGIRH